MAHAKPISRFLWTLVRVGLTVALLAWVVQRIEFRDSVRTRDGRVWFGVVERNGPAEVRLSLSEGGMRTWPAAECVPVGEGFVQPGFWSITRGMDWGTFALFFALFLVPILIGVFRWQILLHVQGVQVSFWRALQLTWIGLFSSAFMPGLTGGDLVKAVLVARNTHTRRTGAVLTVFLDRLVGLVALAVLAASILVFHLGEPALRQAALASFGFLAAGAVGTLLYLSPSVRAMPWVQAMLARLPFQQIRREVDEAFLIYRKHPGAVVATFVLSLGAHFMWCLTSWGFGRAIGITQAAWHHYFAFVPVIMILSALPTSIGGWGMGEALFIYFFKPVGVDPTAAVTLSVLGRLVSLVWNIPGGLFLLRRTDRLAMQEAAIEVEAAEEASGDPGQALPDGAAPGANPAQAAPEGPACPS